MRELLLLCNSGNEIINKDVASTFISSAWMRKIVLKLSNEHECLFQLITCVQVLNQESYFKFTLLFKLTKVGEQFLDP